MGTYQAWIVEALVRIEHDGVRVLLTLLDLAPLLEFCTVLSVINVFSVYRESYLLLGGYPDQSVYMLPNFLMNSFSSFNLNQMYASSTVFVLAASVLVTAGVRSGMG